MLVMHSQNVHCISIQAVLQFRIIRSHVVMQFFFLVLCDVGRPSIVLQILPHDTTEIRRIASHPAETPNEGVPKVLRGVFL